MLLLLIPRRNIWELIHMVLTLHRNHQTLRSKTLLLNRSMSETLNPNTMCTHPLGSWRRHSFLLLLLLLLVLRGCILDLHWQRLHLRSRTNLKLTGRRREECTRRNDGPGVLGDRATWRSSPAHGLTESSDRDVWPQRSLSGRADKRRPERWHPRRGWTSGPNLAVHGVSEATRRRRATRGCCPAITVLGLAATSAKEGGRSGLHPRRRVDANSCLGEALGPCPGDEEDGEGVGKDLGGAEEDGTLPGEEPDGDLGVRGAIGDGAEVDGDGGERTPCVDEEAGGCVGAEHSLTSTQR